MKLKNYEFQLKNWPPPKDETYEHLFGFDEQYQPYIIRRETTDGKYWCGVTLSTVTTASAFPKYISGKELDERIKWWAEAPLLRATINKN